MVARSTSLDALAVPIKNSWSSVDTGRPKKLGYEGSKDGNSSSNDRIDVLTSREQRQANTAFA